MSNDDHHKVSGRWRSLGDIAILVAVVIILFNPSGVVGGRLFEWYGDWRTRQAVERVWPTLVEGDSKLGKGGSDAKKLVVEFVDYECPSCRMLSRTVSSAVAAGEVTVVVRHLPLVGLHPEARPAALAAICAERQGAFESMHNTLLAEEGWTSRADWRAVAHTAGVGDVDRFDACLTDATTLQRLELDRRLADDIGVKGTPTFVTSGGLFEGARGFAQALRSIRRDADDVVVVRKVRVGHELAFDSRRHIEPSVANLGSIGGGFFVEEGHVAIIDGRLIHFIDYRGTDVTSVGGQGKGPGEFQFFPQVVRYGAAGLVAYDLMLGRASWFASDGELVRTKRVATDAREMLSRELVAAFADGSLVFRDDGVLPEGREGVFRQPVHYVEVPPMGADHQVAQALGREMFLEPGRTLFGKVDVLFGDMLLEAALGESLAIADTDATHIEIFDRIGDLVGHLPMPGKLAVTEVQRRAGLQEAMAAERRFSRLGRRVLQRAPTLRMGFDGEPEPELAIPVNDDAPPIDRMFADSDGRLWMRRYRLPGEGGTQWTAWDIEKNSPELMLNLDGGQTLLDARGQFVLVHHEDELGVDHFVVGRMESAGEGGG